MTIFLNASFFPRLSLNDKTSRRFSKSPVELAETTFTMTTIEEEAEITLSLKGLQRQQQQQQQQQEEQAAIASNKENEGDRGKEEVKEGS